MAPHKKTYYKESWKEKFLWIQEVEVDKTSAKCLWCKRIFSLSNMGEQAVYSHGRSATHSRAQENHKTSSITKFFRCVSNQKAADDPLSQKNINCRIVPTSQPAARGTYIEFINYFLTVPLNTELFKIFSAEKC